MKNKILLLISGIFILISGMFFLIADGDGTIIYEYGEGEVADVGSIIGPNLEASSIVIENMKIEKQGDLSLLTFNSDATVFSDKSSTVEINGNKVENFVTRDGKDSILKINEDGEIVEVKLYVSDNKRGKIMINGVEIDASQKSVVTYKNGKLNIEVPDGESISLKNYDESLGVVTYEGNNFEISRGDEEPLYFNQGDRLHYDGKNYFIKEGDNIDYNGVSFSPKERVNFYFGDKIPDGTAGISLGKESFSFACGDNPDIGSLTLSGSSEYYKLKDVNGKLYSTFIEKGDLHRWDKRKELEFSFLEPNSNANFFSEISMMDPNIPSVDCSGGYKVEAGTAVITKTDGKIYHSLNSEKEAWKSLEVIIKDSSGEKFNHEIQFGENSNVRLRSIEKGANMEDYGYSRVDNIAKIYNFDKKSEIYEEYIYESSKTITDGINKNVNDIKGCQKKLINAWLKKYPDSEKMLEEYGGKVDVKDLESMMGNVNDKYFLTQGEVSDTLGISQEEYFSLKNSVENGIGISTLGTDEKLTSAEIVGFRNLFISWNELPEISAEESENQLIKIVKDDLIKKRNRDFILWYNENIVKMQERHIPIELSEYFHGITGV